MQSVVCFKYAFHSNFKSLLSQMDYTSYHSKLGPLLKQLTKKDSKTQNKAAEEIYDIIVQDKEALQETARLWVFIFQATALQSLSLRKVVIKINDYLFKELKKDMAPVIRDIFGLWLMNIGDVPLALESLQVFPNISRVLDFAKDTVPSLLITYLSDREWTGNASVAINFIFNQSKDYFDNYMAHIESNLLKVNNTFHYALLLTLLEQQKTTLFNDIHQKCLSDFTGLSSEEYWKVLDYPSIHQLVSSSTLLISFLSKLFSLPNFKLETCQEPLKLFLTSLDNVNIGDILENAIGFEKSIVNQLYCHFQTIGKITIFLSNTSTSELLRYKILQLVVTKVDQSLLQYFSDYKNDALLLFSNINSDIQINPAEIIHLLNTNDNRFLKFDLNESHALQLIPLITNFENSTLLYLHLIKTQICLLLFAKHVFQMYPVLMSKLIEHLYAFDLEFLIQYKEIVTNLPIHDRLVYYTIASLVPELPLIPMQTDIILDLFYHHSHLNFFFSHYKSHSADLVFHLLIDKQFHDHLDFLPVDIVTLLLPRITTKELVERGLLLPNFLQLFVFNDFSFIDNCTMYSYLVDTLVDQSSDLVLDPILAHKLNLEYSKQFVYSLDKYNLMKEKMQLYKHCILKSQDYLMKLKDISDINSKEFQLCFFKETPTKLLKSLFKTINNLPDSDNNYYIKYCCNCIQSNQFFESDKCEKAKKAITVMARQEIKIDIVQPDFKSLFECNKAPESASEFLLILDKLPHIFSAQIEYKLKNFISKIDDIDPYYQYLLKTPHYTQNKPLEGQQNTHVYFSLFQQLLLKCCLLETEYCNVYKQRRSDEEIEPRFLDLLTFNTVEDWFILFECMSLMSGLTRQDMVELLVIPLESLFKVLIEELQLKTTLLKLNKLTQKSFINNPGNPYMLLYTGLVLHFGDYVRQSLINTQITLNFIQLMEFTWIRQDIQIQLKALQDEFESNQLNLKILNNTISTECRVIYEIDDSKLQVAFILPKEYPIKPLQVQAIERIGVTQHLLNSWLLASRLLIMNKNGSLLDGVELFSKNVVSHFAGQSECTICFSIIGVLDKSLPNKTCLTCSNKFHGGCLQRWFRESKQTNCPLCRSLFRF